MRLFDWGPSPFCMKVRAILDYKGVDYERVMVLGPPLVELWRRGRIGKVPALEIDGQLICDSTNIAHALEERFPHKRILPKEARTRALCHALEDWADESLYFIGIYFQWREPEGAALVPATFHRIPVLGRVAYPLFDRVIQRQLWGQGVGRKPVAHVAADLERHLDAVEALLEGREFLLDEGPLLCDFALASQLHYLRRTPVGGRAVDARGAIGAYLDRMKSFRRS